MIAEKPHWLGVSDDLPVHRENVARLDLDRRRVQYLAIQGDAALCDKPLHVAPGGDASTCERLGDALGALTWRLRVGWLGVVDHDLRNMRIALEAAQDAAARGETPVGAVVLDPASGEIIATASNSPIELHDPTAHAEILAIRRAAAKLGNYRLSGLSLFVTLEPCAMCAGAISHARIGRLVYGASDPKGGAIEHGPHYFSQATCHWRPQVKGGVLGDESAELLRRFFRARRKPRQA